MAGTIAKPTPTATLGVRLNGVRPRWPEQWARQIYLVSRNTKSQWSPA